MISILPSPNNATPPCVLKLLQRQGLTKIVAFSWCNREHDAGNPGIMQVPDGMVGRACKACQAEIKRIVPIAKPAAPK